MRIRILSLLIVFLLINAQTRAQELRANVTVLSNRIGTGVPKQVFQTLQSALYDFLNGRKWTNESFSDNEKITCNFLLNLTSGADNIYGGSLTIQAGRPVYNSSYQSPLINFMDEAISFRYVQFQPLDFNETRVQGTDPTAANLTAIFAYYVYMILGLDFDSFGLRGGDPYYQKALNIVNNAPEGTTLTGWKPFDGVRNRYWLVENLTNSKYNPLHDAIYNYYRQGLDQLYDHEADARPAIINALVSLNDVNIQFPGLMFMDFFFQGRATELSNIFKNGTPDEKSRALDLLTRLDIPNANRYKQDLQ
ncbi:MAG TPA: DUF4835 family protein [Puia sp.]|nr:DUF4835 family protein [Puia sp.]